MAWANRRYALAVGVAALLSTQIVLAAPVATEPPAPQLSGTLDLLVVVSILGTSTSRAAAMAMAVAQSTPCPPGTVPAQPGPNGEPPQGARCIPETVPEAPVPPRAPNTVAFLGLPLLAAAGLGAAVSGGGNGKGNISPISPA